MNRKCKHCGEPLNEAQYIGAKLKSCPKCSQDDGNEHIYYEYPVAFGTLVERITINHPDGLQSYCQNCRDNYVIPHPGAIKCSDVKKK